MARIRLTFSDLIYCMGEEYQVGDCVMCYSVNPPQQCVVELFTDERVMVSNLNGGIQKFWTHEGSNLLMGRATEPLKADDYLEINSQLQSILNL